MPIAPLPRRPRCAARKALCALLLCWSLAAVHPGEMLAQESPRARLEAAISVYEHGGYLEASTRLSSLLYPLKLVDRQDIARARLYLGLCYFVLGLQEDAAQEFRGLFRVDPSYQPDPLKIPPEVVTFIERQRPAPQRTKVVQGLGEKLPAEPLPQAHFAPFNLLPLGIPQLARGDLGRGIALASAEGILLGINVASYWYLVTNNVYENTPEDVYPRLQAARAINVASLGTLALTVALGMGDALYRYRLPAPVQALRIQLEPLQDPVGASSPQQSSATGFQLRFSTRF